MNITRIDPASNRERLLGSNATLRTRPLVHEDEIRAAQQLVYQVFVQEMGWLPKSDNPSGIHFSEWRGSLIFLDRYDCAATWVGTFCEDELVACWRWCRPVNGLFEMELYHPIPAFLKTPRCMEVNRFVVHPDFRRRARTVYHLICNTYQHLYREIDYGFCATAFPHPGELYLRMGLMRADHAPFKYSPDDDEVVHLLVLYVRNQSTLISRCGRRHPEFRAECPAAGLAAGAATSQ
jgi:hypothetical protein